MSKQLGPILGDPDAAKRRARGPGAALFRMFVTMMADLGIASQHSLHRWNLLMEKYLADPKNCVPNTPKDRTSRRGNLIKEFTKYQMTWKVFLNSLRFFGVVKFEFSIKAYYQDGRTSIHTETVNFGSDEPTIQFGGFRNESQKSRKSSNKLSNRRNTNDAGPPTTSGAIGDPPPTTTRVSGDETAPWDETGSERK